MEQTSSDHSLLASRLQRWLAQQSRYNFEVGRAVAKLPLPKIWLLVRMNTLPSMTNVSQIKSQAADGNSRLAGEEDEV